MEELLKNISSKDLEKLKMLLSIIPGQEQKEVVTLRVFRDEYLNLIKNNRSKSYFVSVNITFNHLIDFFGIQNSISAIQLKDVENFLVHLQQKVRKSASSSRGEGYRVYYRTLKAAFNKAVDWGYVKENYFHKVKLPKKQQVNPVFISSDQLSVISNQIKIEVVKNISVFAFYTGMRLNEIINLTWRNVDLTAKTITVGDENFTTKGRNQRYIPICEEVFEVLKARGEKREVRGEKSNVKSETRSVEITIPHDSKPAARLIRLNQTVGDAPTVQQNSLQASPSMTKGYVFCKKDGTKYCGNYISRKFKKACTTAGVEKEIHFHSLRHSFASNLVQKGVSLYTIKELLGHSSITTTEIYSHLNMDCLREAIGKFDGRITKDEVKKQDHATTNTMKIFRINFGEGK